MRSARVLIFVFYFGRLPRWFPLFLETCKRNVAFDWLLVTDQDISIPLPENFRTEKTSMKCLQDFFSSRLGMPILIGSPYKLCDTRPALGRIYQDHLRDYEFWGHCDLDVIFGDLQMLFTSGCLGQADIFTPYDVHPNGSFNLYRNTERINSLYEALPQFRIAFLRNAPSYFLDEIGMQYAILNSKEKINWVRLGNYPDEVAKLVSPTVVHIHADGSALRYDSSLSALYSWENGHTFVTPKGEQRREVLLLHFQGLRRRACWALYDGFSTPSIFYLSQLGYNPRSWTDSPFWKSERGRKIFPSLAGLYSRIARR